MTTSERSSKHITPSGTQSPPYAGFWPRFAGSSIDWIICFFAPVLIFSFALVAISGGEGGPGSDGPQAVLGLLWGVFVVSSVLGYFTYFLARGQSLGMKAVGIHIVNPRTGRPPGVARALVRSFLALVFAASAFLLASFGFSDAPQSDLSSTDLAVIYSSVFVFLAGVLGRLWMIWDPKRQTLQDKLSGVVVGKTAPLGAGV